MTQHYIIGYGTVKESKNRGRLTVTYRDPDDPESLIHESEAENEDGDKVYWLHIENSNMNTPIDKMKDEPSIAYEMIKNKEQEVIDEKENPPDIGEERVKQLKKIGNTMLPEQDDIVSQTLMNGGYMNDQLHGDRLLNDRMSKKTSEYMEKEKKKNEEYDYFRDLDSVFSSVNDILNEYKKDLKYDTNRDMKLFGLYKRLKQHSSNVIDVTEKMENELGLQTVYDHKVKDAHKERLIIDLFKEHAIRMSKPIGGFNKWNTYYWIPMKTLKYKYKKRTGINRNLEYIFKKMRKATGVDLKRKKKNNTRRVRVTREEFDQLYNYYHKPY